MTLAALAWSDLAGSAFIVAGCVALLMISERLLRREDELRKLGEEQYRMQMSFFYWRSRKSPPERDAWVARNMRRQRLILKWFMQPFAILIALLSLGVDVRSFLY